MKKEELFTTRDINLAASLLTSGFKLETTDYQQEGDNNRLIGYFGFIENDELRSTEKKYWAGELLLEPRAFVNNLRSLKAQISGKFNNPHS